MLIQDNLSVQEKLKILTAAAKYDVSCTSSGVNRKGKAGSMGNASEMGICHSFSADGRCISLFKILFTNQCIYDCKYCINRCSNDVVRTSFTPEEICRLTMEFYSRNYIEGLFLSSGILHSADYTMELLVKTLWILRKKMGFGGYIHVKAIPGASPSLIEQAGFLADRMSVNLELPTADGLKNLAPGKTRDKILTPMRQIQRGIAGQMIKEGMSLPDYGSYPAGGREIEKGSVKKGSAEKKSEEKVVVSVKQRTGPKQQLGRSRYGNFGLRQVANHRDYFVPAGQSTQIIVGATPESDYQMLMVTEALYQRFGLKRVFYSAYVSVNEDSALPVLPGGPPLLREHRLYQADWLMRYYGFDAGELLSEKQPNFNVFLDPKCDWALRNLGQFPVEVNRASYAMLLRVPGIGTKSAMRIVAARKQAALRFEDLKKMGVVLKRALYFITCSGRMMYPIRMSEDSIAARMIGEERRKTLDLEQSGLYRQMSMFDDFHMERA